MSSASHIFNTRTLIILRALAVSFSPSFVTLRFSFVTLRVHAFVHSFPKELADNAIQEGGVFGLGAGGRLVALQRRNFDKPGAGYFGGGGASGFCGIEQIERRRKNQRRCLDRSQSGLGVALQSL